MSMCLCELCERPVDTDFDCDSLYVKGYDMKCVCEHCVDKHNLEYTFETYEVTKNMVGK